MGNGARLVARYYVEAQGRAGVASRIGGKASGVWSHARGWTLGARVDVNPAAHESAEDHVEVSLTGGSSRRHRGRDLVSASQQDDGTVQICQTIPRALAAAVRFAEAFSRSECTTEEVREAIRAAKVTHPGHGQPFVVFSVDGQTLEEISPPPMGE